MWGSHAPTRVETAETPTGSDTVSNDDFPPLIPVAAQGGRIVDLAAFEKGVGGWRGGDRVTLDRINDGHRPGTVTEGSVALRLDCDGPVTATVTNERGARDADWVDHPFLTGTIMPGTLAGADGPIRAHFRLVHANGQSGRSRKTSSSGHARTRAHTGRGRGNDRRHSALTSETFEAAQGQPVRLYWDLRDIDERVRSSIVRLEIVFERADQQTVGEPRGRGPSTGIRGPIFVEDVSLSDSPDVIAAAKLQTHWQRLVASYGEHVETVTEVKKRSVESGRFVFSDGEVDYRFAIRSDGTHDFSLGDSIYHFEDGMAAVEPQ